MFVPFLLTGLAVLTPCLVHAVNYEPTSAGNVLGVDCSGATLRLTLNPATAQVYAAYVASQDSWPARLFFANYNNDTGGTPCSPYGTLAAFSVGSAGALQGDGTTYTITDFSQIPAPDAAVAAQKDMKSAMLRAQLEDFKETYSCDPNAGCDEAFKKALQQVPSGYQDIVNALGRLASAPTTDGGPAAAGGRKAKREAVLLVVAGEVGESGVAAGGPTNPVGDVLLVAAGILALIGATMSLFGGSSGSPGNLQALRFPTIYFPPWFIILDIPGTGTGTGTGTDSPTSEGNDDDDPNTTTVTTLTSTSMPTSTSTSSASSTSSAMCPGITGESDPNTPSGFTVPDSGACGVFLKNLEFTRPDAQWTAPAPDALTASIGSSEVKGTLVYSCKTPKDWTAGTALKNKFDLSLEKGMKDLGLLGGAAPPGTCAAAYWTLDLTGDYNVLGGGEIDIDFEINLAASLYSIAGTTASDGSGVSASPSGARADPVFAITRIAASVSMASASFGLDLGVGIKEYAGYQEVLDLGFTTSADYKLTGSNLGATLTSNATVSRRQRPHERRSRQDRRDDPNAVTIQICNQDATLKSGIETDFTAKVAGSKVFTEPIQPLTYNAVKVTGFSGCL